MKVMCLIDLQGDFIDGSLGSPEAQTIVPRIVEKLKNTDLSNTLVLFTKDTHYDDYLETFEGKHLPVKHCIENTPGWCIHKDISSIVDDTPGALYYSSTKIKHSRVYKNTFGSDDLREFFIKHKDEIEEIEFLGLCTDICVISNVLATRQALPEMKIVVDASCCAGTNVDNHKAALTTMKSCQIEIINN